MSGDFSNFEADARASMLCGIGGLALLIMGGIVRGIGARGLAGSGIVLDPEKARQELEPYGRMAGGLVKDALETVSKPHAGVCLRLFRAMRKSPSLDRFPPEYASFGFKSLAAGIEIASQRRPTSNSDANQKMVVMIKCLGCGKLNEEDAKFCQECGKKL